MATAWANAQYESPFHVPSSTKTRGASSSAATNANGMCECQLDTSVSRVGSSRACGWSVIAKERGDGSGRGGSSSVTGGRLAGGSLPSAGAAGLVEGDARPPAQAAQATREDASRLRRVDSALRHAHAGGSRCDRRKRRPSSPSGRFSRSSCPSDGAGRDGTAASIESLLDQAYENWELWVAVDAAPPGWLCDLLADAARRGARVEAVPPGEALARARGEWIVLLGSGCRVRPHALFLIARAIGQHPDVSFVYADDDRLDPGGREVRAALQARLERGPARRAELHRPGRRLQAGARLGDGRSSRASSPRRRPGLSTSG